MIGPVVLILFTLFILVNTIKILREYERGVVFRLGRLVGVRGPGLILLIPLFEKMVKVSLRVIAMDVPPQEVITKDNVSIKVNAVLYFQVFDTAKAIVAVEDYMYATSQMGQTTLRSILGEHELDDLLSNREKINQKLQKILDERTDPWGVKVNAVEVKDVDLPEGMRRAVAHGQAGRGREGAPGQGHPRRRRVPGLRQAQGRRQRHGRAAGDPAAEVPADPDRGGHGEELHHPFPHPHRLPQVLHEGQVTLSRQ